MKSLGAAVHVRLYEVGLAVRMQRVQRLAWGAVSYLPQLLIRHTQNNLKNERTKSQETFS